MSANSLSFRQGSCLKLSLVVVSSVGSHRDDRLVIRLALEFRPMMSPRWDEQPGQLCDSRLSASTLNQAALSDIAAEVECFQSPGFVSQPLRSGSADLLNPNPRFLFPMSPDPLLRPLSGRCLLATSHSPPKKLSPPMPVPVGSPV